MAARGSGSGRACYTCGETGHIARECPAAGKTPAARAATGKTPAARAATSYRETRATIVLEYPNSSAERTAEVKRGNQADLRKLIDTIPDETIRDALIDACAAVENDAEGRLVKEIYLPLGRRAELVTSGILGGSTRIQESDQEMSAEHLVGFTALFDALPVALRRTGISATLHRISRTINPVTQNITSVAARIGRVIEGHVQPMLAAVPHSDGIAKGRLSVMLIGPPNVGKTTVLREMARLLAEDRTRVVAVVDKSLEIAGSGDVPHSSVGNARVLQVDEPANQASVMIEAVENQSPDVVIVDEISSKRQAEAARTIVRRLSVASAIPV